MVGRSNPCLAETARLRVSSQIEPMITHHQLQAFLAVARTGNITKAARELKTKQPTVSLQLGALRRFLGMPLFERPGGKFRLTAAGERLKRYAEDVVSGLRSLQQDIDLLKASLITPLHGALVGSFGLGYTFVLSRYVMPSVLSRFLAKFSGVEIHLVVDLPEPLFDALARGSLDVVCLMNTFVPPGLTAEKVGEEALVVFVSPRHPLAARGRVTPRELSTQPFIASLSPALRSFVDTKLRGAGVTPRVAAEALHHDTIKSLVAREFGYSIVIRSVIANELATGELVALTLEAPPIVIDLVAVYRSTPDLPPVIREFIDFTRRELLHGGSDVAPPVRIRRRPKGGRHAAARRRPRPRG
jgi:DNA-binding transcriptional LysR family regulator